MYCACGMACGELKESGKLRVRAECDGEAVKRGSTDGQKNARDSSTGTQYTPQQQRARSAGGALWAGRRRRRGRDSSLVPFLSLTLTLQLALQARRRPAGPSQRPSHTRLLQHVARGFGKPVSPALAALDVRWCISSVQPAGHVALRVRSLAPNRLAWPPGRAERCRLRVGNTTLLATLGPLPCSAEEAPWCLCPARLRNACAATGTWTPGHSHRPTVAGPSNAERPPAHCRRPLVLFHARRPHHRQTPIHRTAGMAVPPAPTLPDRFHPSRVSLGAAARERVILALRESVFVVAAASSGAESTGSSCGGIHDRCCLL